MDQTRTAALHAHYPLSSPRVLAIEHPVEKQSWETVKKARTIIKRILCGKDNRLLAVIGPCSIHDPDAALEYATRLNRLRTLYEDRIFIIMRVYLEKPRTSVGWKGLINDPDMNGNCHIAQGLRISRKLLISITSMGLPAGMEILDPIISHYVGDLASWASIGARTSESQIHRQMASGLAMPVGFKNTTYGCLETAVNSITAARNPHSFLSIDSHGRVCIARTKGNPWCHLVLRGDTQGPNYDHHSLTKAVNLLKKNNINRSLLVDCSHMNAGKHHLNQLKVWEELINLRSTGDHKICGLMVESNLEEGCQRISGNRHSLKYGVSVTDNCLGWDQTERLLGETYGILK